MYWVFRIFRKPHDKDFDNFIKLKIAQNTSYNIKITKIPFNLDENSFRNVFYYESYEINIEKVGLNIYDVNIFPLRKSNKVSLKFGCELETCLNLYCSKESIRNIAINMVYLKERMLSNDSNNTRIVYSYWVKLLNIYIKDVIIPKINDDFIKLFPKAYIAIYPKSGYSDYVVDMKSGEINESIEPIFYNTIVFTRDASLLCSDTNLSLEVNPKDKQTLHCEIITPILSSMKELSILYNTLIKPGCLNANESTAFHINISMYDEENKPIYFSLGFIDAFLNRYETFENKKFAFFETRETKYAMKLHNYSQYYTLAKYKDMIYLEDNKIKKDFSYENFIEGEKFYRCYINLKEKYNSIYLKSPTLMEFRLFPSHENQNILFEYLNDSFDILLDSYSDFSSGQNYVKVLKNLQSKNLIAKIDYNNLKSYEGDLFYENEQFPELKIVNIYKSDEIVKGVNYLFMKRNQRVIDYEYFPYEVKYIFNVLSLNDNKISSYSLKINKDKTIKITLI